MSLVKILIVEDTESWQKTYEEWFSVLNYSTWIAGTLEDAKKLCDDLTFDVAVVDINLSKGPGNRDGLMVVDILQKVAPKTQIVIVSGSIDQSLRENLESRKLTFVPRAELRYRSFIDMITEKIRKAHMDQPET